MAWIYLIIAAAFEAAWTFSLKFMKFSDLKALRWHSALSLQYGLPVWLPFAGYVLFGIGNIYFFSLAIKLVPTAVAYAVWTAITLVLIKIAEMAIFHQKLSWMEVFFMTLIMSGILGLKFFGAEVK
ncbi:DMT family transporter [Mucilaginibacter sp. AW1-7]|uniref:DMT family transporter n=1 Tax=unclassified Mucilaginibacter TaxID=2617802 RepID=UPI0008CCAF43|nr:MULTISPECIES: SMR family transporter [unclassified Mucilaginibacter]WDF80033.1 SMR family transporter [Mucilaginibacter sp. KACC 22773]SEO96751.1 quaternary ammonium compound-resistance protein SugE [Mucilaginibacter sp. OK283]